jgi:alpha-beta hydrolase superfamily lysophospholipase/SAM-dependent methyltransferase
VIEKPDPEGLRETTGTFTTWDGRSLFYRAWHPVEPAKGALILIHRGHEHSGRVRNLVRELNLEGFSAFSWDSRGHGHSPGDRGFAPSFGHIVRDLDTFSNYVTANYGVSREDTVVVANSIGSIVAAAWVHDCAPRIRAMVLAAPAFSIKLYVPFALPLLRLQMKLVKEPFVKSYVRPGLLTSDPTEVEAYTQDGLIARNVSVRILCELDHASRRILEDAAAITTPTLVLSAGSDWVVRNAPQKQFFDRLSSQQKAYELYPGFKHAIFHEAQRRRPIRRTREFVLRAFESAVDRTPLQQGAAYTRQEHERLSRPAPPFKGTAYALTRATMKTLGRLSNGIRLGWDRGFSSGEMLDYIYANRPGGSLIVGGMIDRTYLDAVGWRGIRIRGEHLEARLERAIESQLKSQGSARIVDLAAGAGRYVLNILDRIRGSDVFATLCDRDTAALEQGRSRAAYLGLTNLTWTQSDAFNPEEVRSVSAGAGIAIVSGLYELFPDNEPVSRSLSALHESLAPGGLLIYTGQPWHPQLEFIARTLIHQDGSPWIMRRRTQAELDELVRAAGFDKQAMDIDQYGIFTVSVAKKDG